MHYLGEVENIYKSIANIFRTINSKFYQNRPGFVDDVTKNIWCVSGSQFQLLLFTYKTR